MWRLLEAACPGEGRASEGEIDTAQASLHGCIAAMTDGHEAWTVSRAAAALDPRPSAHPPRHDP